MENEQMRRAFNETASRLDFSVAHMSQNEIEEYCEFIEAGYTAALARTDWNRVETNKCPHCGKIESGQTSAETLADPNQIQ